ncbi:glycoside hydrolase family 140 protein [Anaerolinea sp.]|uniref:glycoside hydrolase family 140 protein n=1 Tax=Anaerolinea sp. TaxID=1872519 RepID=UPI002ACE29AC|nr:glycoside hydrolase family 140 protein [Anaerolinea sp.]
MKQIGTSKNQRFLADEEEKPFFWLADTAWELFHRLSLAEITHYFEVRRRQGFNLIQAVLLAELNGLHVPNANGHIPLCGDDPARPNEFYFRFVDEVVQLAEQYDLYVGLLPTWGDKVHGGLWGIGPVIFNEGNARVYGNFLGERYRRFKNVVWILGGDRSAEGYVAVWKSLAEGIIEGLGHKPLMTYHPMGGFSSSKWLHQQDWLSMNMLQSGHVLLDAPNWEMIARDLALQPVKPVLDGEPNYEDHPIDPYLREWEPKFGRFTDYDVRKQAYRSVFAGACGHTYGNHSVWQFWDLSREPVTYPMRVWQEAIFAPGASQLTHLKSLMLSRPYFTRIPDQSLLPEETTPPPVQETQSDKENSARAAHSRATRAEDGSYAMVYIPQPDKKVIVDLSKLAGTVQAWRYDPRTGKSFEIGVFSHHKIQQFTTPFSGPDWVLVLDEKSRKFGAPGTPQKPC